MSIQAPIGTDFIVNTTTAGPQGSGSLATLPDGRHVMVWHSDDRPEVPAGTSGYAIRMRMFAPDGTPIGSDTLVNASPGHQAGDQASPLVLAMANGSFIVTWMTHRTWPALDEIGWHVFDQNGPRSTAT